MNMDTQSANQSPTQVNLESCQTVVIGDNTVIKLTSSETQENVTGTTGVQPKKVTIVLPDEPFHVTHERRKELNEIERMFSDMNDVLHEDVVKTVYLTGPPGAGKTVLARQYGKELGLKAMSSNDISITHVITLNAKSEESLLRSAKEVSRKLRMQLPAGMNTNLANLMEELKQYLCTHSGTWFLIVDDMFENNEFNKFLPRPGSKDWGGGEVLVTTQDNNIVPACHQLAKKFPLDEGMSKTDALALLTGVSKVEVDEFADEIVELHNIPLALACCATLVGETREDRASTLFGWKEYLNLYHEQPNVESRTFSNSNESYPFSVTKATTMAVNRMAESSVVLRLVFSFLSYCALLPVPLQLLAHHVMANLPVQDDKRPTMREVEDEISRCSLLVHARSQNVETLKCHQVIHRVFKNVEETKPAKDREGEFVKIMKSLNQTLDFMDNTREDDIVLKVLARPHLQAFVDQANDVAWNNTAEFVLISMKKGQFLFSTTDMPDEQAAVQSLESLCRVSSMLDLSEEGHCDILANIGFYHLELDRNEDALNFLSKAFHMTEGKEQPEWLVLRCRISFNLARTYYAADLVDLAVEMMEWSIELAKRVYVKEEEKIMNRFAWLFDFHLSWDKFWKLRGILDEAMDFLCSRPQEHATLSRACSLLFLSRMCVRCSTFSIIPFTSRHYFNVAEKLFNQSQIIYEQVLDEDVSLCPEYRQVLILTALFAEPGAVKTKLERAHEMCVQNDDTFRQCLINTIMEHLFDSPWRRAWLRWIRNLRRGRVLYNPAIATIDDIVDEYERGGISPSRQMINSYKRLRTFVAWYEKILCLLLVGCLILLIFLSTRISRFLTIRYFGCVLPPDVEL